MATTLSVVNYSDKLNVLQQSNVPSNAKQLQRQIIILRKTPDMANNNTSNISINNTLKRKPKTKDLNRPHNPPPVAVARRNARERNRVKQVNNGFATLRQHIPTAIAAAFDSGSGRGGGNNKKLSKVETLRMAVEYIKSLEKLLTLSTSEDNSTSSSSYSYQDDEEKLQSLQNVNNRKAFHIMYEDEENIHPSAIEGLGEDLIHNTNMDLSESHSLTLLNSIDNSASLSPGVYSENSLSPVHIDNEIGTYTSIPVFNASNQILLPPFNHLNYKRLPEIKTELLSPNESHDNTIDAISESQIVCISGNQETLDQHGIEVFWWQQQQQPRS